MASFEQLKTEYDSNNAGVEKVDCFLPIHLTYGKEERNLYKKDGTFNEQLSNSIASIDSHKEARKWLCENMRIVAIIDWPPNIFAEAGVSPTIIFAYKPTKEELETLKKQNYQVFSKEIKKVGYEVKTKNKVKCFETRYKLNPKTFEKEINSDGTAKLDEEFTETVAAFKQWRNMQEDTLKKLF